MLRILKKSVILAFLTFLSFSGYTQTLQGSCERAGFGIDGYTYANGTEYVGSSVPINENTADDWFFNSSVYDGPGRNVIDTTGALFYRNLLLGGNNIFFAQKMAVPPNSIINGRRWQDATYVRDYFGGSGAIDSTSYVTASKNGEPLEDWDTGVHNVVPKNDLIDCYAHLRRDGAAAENPLWLYLGFSRISSTGNSYFDAELFANEVVYDPASGFEPVGTEEGHTAWQFDELGNITEIGDMIVTVNMNTDNIPDFELRIWVKRFDFENLDPAGFDFGNDIDGASVHSSYGYADILPPIGNEFGCGVTNQEVWPGPPWGTLDDLGNTTNFYQPGQFVEIGLNLYDFGIDPQLIVDLDACDLPFANLIFKARASSSFTAQLKDFAGPFSFVVLGRLESTAVGGIITCDNPVIALEVEEVYPDSYYEWSTIDGNILTDSSSIYDTIIYIDAPGTYILASAYMDDCEVSYDTIVVESFLEEPPANIGSEPVYDCENVISDLYALDDGFLYNWTGPDGSNYTGQNISVNVPGLYFLEVTNEYGCIGTDSIYVLEYACEDIGNPDISTTTIIDTLPPFFTPPNDITLECIDDILDLGITGNVTNEQDNCDPDIAEAIYSDVFDSNGFCNGTGLITRNWSLTDICGNTYTASQQILLIDSRPPLINAPDDVTISCTDDFDDLDLTGQTPMAMDDCDSVSIVVSYNDIFENDFGCDGQVQILRIWEAIDDCGNISRDTQTIMMMDTLGPQIVGVPEIPFAVCDSIPAAPEVTVIDNCDPNPTVVFSETLASASCPNSFVLVRTWTATDACGNQTVITRELNVEDAASPVVLVFPEDITISCDTFPSPYEPEIEDNCASEIDITFNEETILGSCEGNYLLERTWTWTDDCGNTASSTQVISVEDTTPPTFTQPSDITISCEVDFEDLNITGDVDDENDNCTSLIGDASYSDEIILDCIGSGQINRTWSLIDDCGNITEHIQNIVFIDTIPPIFSAPNDLSIQCDQNTDSLSITGAVLNASDNCHDAIGEAVYIDIFEVNSSCSSEGTITRIWSLIDDCGNIALDTQLIFIIDTIPPLFDLPADLSLDCNLDIEDLNITGEPINGSDNCDVNLGEFSFTDIFTSSGYCEGTGQVERTWVISDECGNTTSQVQVITLIDTIPPVFDVPVDVSISCDDNPDDLILTGDVISEFDACNLNIGEAIYNDSIIYNSPCEGSSIIYRTWSLEDACGNIANQTQVIAVEDTSPPILSDAEDITLDCFAELEDTTIISPPIILGDNCSSNFGGVTFIDSILVNDSCNYLIQRFWLGTDACGNIAVDTQMISIIDTIAPVLDSLPSDLTIDCSTVPDALVITAVDNCGETPDVVFDETITAGACSENYTISRSWSSTDNCGNNFTHIQTIVVQDTTPPVILTFPNDTIVSCDAIPLPIDPTVFDNCDNDLTTDFQETIILGNCGENATILRVWTWIDNCDNTSSHTQEITVIDTIAPQFTVPEDLTITCSTNPDDLTFTGDVTDETDNCDSLAFEAVYSDSIVLSIECSESRMIYRNWTLADECGNSASGTQVISVLDTIAPTFTIPSDITLDCNVNPDDLSFTGNVNDESDNCTLSIGEAIYLDSILTNTPCEGSTLIHRMWSLADACGNGFSGEQLITLQDTTPPVMSIPDDLTINCFSELNDSSLINDVLIIGDDCSNTQATLSFNDNILQNDSCNYIIQRIWALSDACGNTITEEQTITIVDTIAPVFNESLDSLILGCDSIPPPFVLTATDNCDATPEIVFNESIIPGTCSNNYTLVRTWTATDDCGNSSVIVQSLEIEDFAEPVVLVFPPDITVSCDSIPSVEEHNVEDNCDSDLTIDFSESINPGTCQNNYTIIRTWTWMDNCNNMSDHIQTIVVVDNTPPIFETPEDITISCQADINDLSFTGNVTNGFNNCGEAIGQAIYSDTVFTDGLCNGSRLIERTWMLSDDCGNTNSGIQLIMLIDTIDPSFTVPEDITLTCGQDANDLNLTGDVSDEFDDCNTLIGEAIYSDSLSVSPPCGGTDIIVREWVLSDDCGNSINQVQLITIEDNEAPIFSGSPVDVTVSCDEIPSLMTPEILDGCGTNFNVDFYTENINQSCENNYTVRRVWTALDDCGNQDSVIQLVTVVDTTGPVILLLPQDTIVECDNLPVVPILDFSNNCGDSINVDFTEEILIGTCVDIQIVNRTWLATDDCGNSTIVSQQITLLDCSPEVSFNLPPDTSICENESILFEINLGEGYDTPYFQWQFTNDTTTIWENITGANDSILLIDFVSTQDSGYYQVLISNEQGDIYNDSCSVVSDLVFLEVFRISIPTLLEASICEGDSIVFNTQILTESGVYSDTLLNNNGCDSIVLMNLNVFPHYDDFISENICFSQEFVFEDSTLTETGLYTFYHQTENGCDSIIHVNLTVIPSIINQLENGICIGDSILFINNYVSDAGQYIDTLIADNGCDSIVVLDLTVYPHIEYFRADSICEGSQFIFGDSIYNTLGSYTHFYQTENGCDSIEHLELTVLENYEATFENHLCYGDTLNGIVYFASITLTDSFQNIHGCDSVLINEIIVHEPSFESQPISLCVGEAFQGTVYLNDTLLVDSFQTIYGCDSIVHVDLAIITSIINQSVGEICIGDSILFINNHVSNAGQYIDTLVSNNGCDSIVILDLIVYPPVEEFRTDSICEGSQFVFGDSIYTTSGDYTHFYQTENGCDSIVHLELTVLENYEAIIESHICYGDTLDGTVYYTSITLTDSLQNIHGCDSLLINEIIVHEPSFESQAITLCLGEPFQGTIYLNDTLLIDSFQNIYGCDSIVHYDLMLLEELTDSLDAVICYGDFWNGNSYFNDTTFINTYISSFGCDSIVTTFLSIDPLSQDTQYLEICEGESILIGGVLQTTSGNYTSIYTSTNGCDSIVLSYLNVHPLSELSLDYTLCEGDTFFVGGAEQTENGVYSDIYQNVNGCDSIVFTSLIFYPVFELEYEYTICQSDSLFLAGAFQNQDGIYYDSLSTVNGCDSIIKTTLNVLEEQIEFFEEITICDGDSTWIAGAWHFESGSFTEILTSQNGCDSLVTTVLDVLEPNSLLAEEAFICYGEEAQLMLEGSGTIENISWYPDFSLSCDDCIDPVAFPEATTTYTVNYSSGCNDETMESDVTVYVNEPLEIELLQTEINIVEGDSVILMVVDADTNLVYTWFDQEGTVICDSCFSIIVNPNNSTSYFVSVDGPGNACSGEAGVTVLVEEMTCEHGTLEVSNVIFPQSEGYGDHLEIRYENVEINVMRIFNRWGQKVFETNDLSVKWDGTYRGKLLNPGVYVYYIIGICDDKTEFIHSGNVTVIH